MTEKNPFHAPIKSMGASVPVEQHRAVQEVQAAMIIAKRFPRDQHAAYGRIMTACERPVLAEAASYDYPKGKTMVTGPTIRLAEVMAQNWGNMEFGIKELSQEGGESEVQAFAWDLETNVRQSKTFRVPHKMKAHGSFKSLTDPRDIYEHVANMGARRLRACILGVIPGDIVDAAVIKCEETLVKGDGKPIEDRARDMLERFKEIEISQELIEKRLQHKVTAIVRSQLVELGKIYNSIKDGMSKRSDWFEVPVSQQESSASDLADKIRENEEQQPPGDEQGAGRDLDSDNDENPKQSDLRGEFINLKTAGYSTWIYKNKERIRSAPSEIQAEAKKKWEGIYPNNPWPLDEKLKTGIEGDPTIPVETEENQPQREPENWIGLYYGCPDMDGKAIAKARCTPEKCEKYEGCPSPYKPDAPAETGEDVAF